MHFMMDLSIYRELQQTARMRKLPSENTTKILELKTFLNDFFCAAKLVKFECMNTHLMSPTIRPTISPQNAPGSVVRVQKMASK